MLNHRLSIGWVEQSLLFPFTRYSHYHVVEQTGRPLDDIEVAVSQGIEAAGINDRFQGRDSSRCTLKKEPGQLPGFSRINSLKSTAISPCTYVPVTGVRSGSGSPLTSTLAPSRKSTVTVLTATESPA